MKLWSTFLEAELDIRATGRNTVVSIGNFDGVHRGHQKIIGRVAELARENGGMAVLVTFVTHTDNLLGQQSLLINSPDFRRELLSSTGLDGLLEIEFDHEFAMIEPEDFFNLYLVDKLQVKGLVIGYDFRFGAKGRGDYQLLQKLGAGQQVTIEQLPPLKEENEVISSSRIRQLIAAGQIEKANQLLGYPFTVNGEVVHGEKRGRTLGFPTANIMLGPEFLLPCFGVYSVRMKVGEEYFFGVASVGVKPTFGIYQPLIEVYLFDVNLDLYGQSVRVEFFKFLRPEKRFSTVAALVEQMRLDVIQAQKGLGYPL